MEILSKKVLVVGAGLAGVEVAYKLASSGIQVYLAESKRQVKNESQRITDMAELVCTNSLKSLDLTTPHGLLKSEMITLNSLVLDVAKLCSVGAGSALAVDRDQFSAMITKRVSNHPNITVIDQVVSDPLTLKKELAADYLVISSGPLTLPPLIKWMEEFLAFKQEDLFFYDAIAPVVDAETLDYSKLYFKDRHAEGMGGDYLNVPLNKEQYYTFVDDVVNSIKVTPKAFEEERFFESCLPIDIMAMRGRETLRFSCMKPIGLATEDGKLPYAVVQLRKENNLGSAYNLVGFQNRLTYGEQNRIFKTLPGFENASFFHLGSVHRNTFIHSAKLCNQDFSLLQDSSIYFAGQLTGVEGYTESAASGLYVATQILSKIKSNELLQFPVTTAMGALVHHVLTQTKPMPTNINFGVMPTPLMPDKLPKGVDRKKYKKGLVVALAQKDFNEFITNKGLNS